MPRKLRVTSVGTEGIYNPPPNMPNRRSSCAPVYSVHKVSAESLGCCCCRGTCTIIILVCGYIFVTIGGNRCRISGSWSCHLPVKTGREGFPPRFSLLDGGAESHSYNRSFGNNSVAELRLVVKVLRAWVLQLTFTWRFVPDVHALHSMGKLADCSDRSKKCCCMRLHEVGKTKLAKAFTGLR